MLKYKGNKKPSDDVQAGKDGKDDADMSGNDTDEKENGEVNEQGDFGAEADNTASDDGPVDSDTDKDESTDYKQQADEYYDKYLRALAELENYKKRIIKERAELLKYAGEYLARDILLIVDDLERALKSTSGGATETFIEGVKLIADNLVGILKKHQIVGEESIGQLFDPQKHEAMAMVPTADHEPGFIIEEMKRMYMFKDKVLRIGQVVVAKEVEKEE